MARQQTVSQLAARQSAAEQLAAVQLAVRQLAAVQVADGQLAAAECNVHHSNCDISSLFPQQSLIWHLIPGV